METTNDNEQQSIYPNGTIIADRFEIESFLAAGGMAQVYVARQLAVDRRVALKVLSPMFSMNPSIVMRFFREAKVIAKLSHPSTVQLIDMGETPDKRLYMSMELLDGEELGERIRRGRMKAEEVIPIIRQVAGSLSEAHSKGIIHRDLKPANIFLTKMNIAKVLDFGIAKLKESDDQDERKLTKVGTAPGTPEYMSPEQARGKELDARSDLYSLGVVMYEMLAGHPPFEEDSFLATILMHVQAVPPPLPDDVPVQLRNYIINRMLAKDPNCRPDDADCLIKELDELEQKINPSKEQALIDELRSQLAATKLELLRSCEQSVIEEAEADRMYAEQMESRQLLEDSKPPSITAKSVPSMGPASFRSGMHLSVQDGRLNVPPAPGDNGAFGTHSMVTPPGHEQPSKPLSMSRPAMPPVPVSSAIDKSISGNHPRIMPPIPSRARSKESTSSGNCRPVPPSVPSNSGINPVRSGLQSQARMTAVGGPAASMNPAQPGMMPGLPPQPVMMPPQGMPSGVMPVMGTQSAIPVQSGVMPVMGTQSAIPVQSGVMPVMGTQSAIPVQSGVMPVMGTQSAIPVQSGVMPVMGTQSAIPVQSGMMPPQAGMMPPGMMPPQAGMMSPGMMPPQAGMMSPGMMAQGMMSPGMMPPQAGMMSPGMPPQPGMMAQGMMSSGMPPQPGMMNHQSGMMPSVGRNMMPAPPSGISHAVGQTPCQTPGGDCEEAIIPPRPRHLEGLPSGTAVEEERFSSSAALPSVSSTGAMGRPRDPMTGRPSKLTVTSKPPKMIFMEFVQPLLKCQKDRIPDTLRLAEYIWNACSIGGEAVIELLNDANERPGLRRIVDLMMARKEKYYATEHWTIDKLKVEFDDDDKLTVDFEVMGE